VATHCEGIEDAIMAFVVEEGACMERKRRANLHGGGIGVKLMILVGVLVFGGEVREGRGFGAKRYERR